MKTIEDKYIDVIGVPYLDEGDSKVKPIYFDFPDSQYQFISKRAYLILCVDVALFVMWFGIKNKLTNPLLFWGLPIVIALLAFFYEYELRYMNAYKTARKAARKKSYKYSFLKLQKVIESPIVYDRDVPLVYTVLKAKQLLKNNKVELAETIIETATERYPDENMVWYIAALCAYAYEDLEEMSFRFGHIDADEDMGRILLNYVKELHGEGNE